MSDIREQWRTKLLASHSDQLSMQEISNLATLIEAALTRAKGAVREACAEHWPILERGHDDILVHAECCCGHKLEANLGWLIDWQEHIRSLPDPSVQSYEAGVGKASETA